MTKSNGKAIELTGPEHELLVLIERDTFQGGGATCRKSPHRDRLKRLGLIKSGKTNPASMRAISGKLARWRTTDSADAYFEAIKKADDEEKELTGCSVAA